MKKRLLFYCQPVLGIGHYIRSREIVRRLRNFDVCFLQGGEVAPGFELPSWVEMVHLPALKSDADFQDLHVPGGGQSLAQVKEARAQLLLATCDRFDPDILLIELFPFGRRKFDYELIPLLEHVRSSGRSAKVVCSLRDILVAKRNQAQYEEEVCALLNRYFDLLLIHADPEFQRLEETFPSAGEIRCAVRYTGYVAPPQEGAADGIPPVAPGEALILATIGGGRVGRELLECAVAAGDLIAAEAPHRMLIVAGPHLPADQFEKLEAMAACRPRVMLRRSVAGLYPYLRRADLSISMAGYNTCLEILSAGVRALVYPFTGHNNQEQTIRARKLERLGALRMIPAGQLAPERLAAEIVRGLAEPLPSRSPALDLMGAEKSAVLLAELVNL